MRMISILGLIALPSVFVKTVVCLTKATSPFPTARHLNWQERWSNHQGKGQCSSQKTITSLRFCYVVDSCGLQCSELWRLNQHLKSVCFFFFLFFFTILGIWDVPLYLKAPSYPSYWSWSFSHLFCPELSPTHSPHRLAGKPGWLAPGTQLSVKNPPTAKHHGKREKAGWKIQFF